MNLWIMSQDKTMLEKATSIKVHVENYRQKVDLTLATRVIAVEYCIEVNDEIFGIYKSEKRAKQILDDIRFTLTGGVMVPGGVYVMPKE